MAMWSVQVIRSIQIVGRSSRLGPIVVTGVLDEAYLMHGQSQNR